MDIMSAQPLEILSDPLQDARFFYAGDARPIRCLQRRHAADHCSQIVLDRNDWLRDELADVRHTEEGLDTARIAGYFKRLGLPFRPFAGVDEAGQRKIRKIMNFTNDDATVASHFTMQDYTYVLRKPDETSEESLLVEMNAVHELSHRDRHFIDIVCHYDPELPGNVGYNRQRSGFKIFKKDDKRGLYFDEGRSGLIDHGYVTHELGRPDGLLGRAEPRKPDGIPNPSYRVPGSYYYNALYSGNLSLASSAHAAFGMQLLVAKDPAIFPAMLQATQNVEGLREFAGRVNSIERGLYTKLQALPYDSAKFASATGYIIDNVYAGSYHKAEEIAREQDHTGSGELLAA